MFVEQHIRVDACKDSPRSAAEVSTRSLCPWVNDVCKRLASFRPREVVATSSNGEFIVNGRDRGKAAEAINPGLPRDLPSLTSLRGFAALGVFFYHLQGAGVISFPPAQLGYTGVAFFFILSGFVLAWGYKSDVSVERFYVRRIARVFPSHFVMWSIVLIFSSAAAIGSTAPVTAAINLLLMQAWAPDYGFAFSVNGVAWSLSCEMAFYAAFPLVMKMLLSVSRSAMWTIAIGCFTFSAVFVVATTGVLPTSGLGVIQYVNPVVRFPEFLLGIVAALSIQSGWRPGWLSGLVACVVATAGFIWNHDHPAANVWATIFFTAFIVAMVRSDIVRPFKLMRSRTIIYAGKVSFCFYLVHQWVIIRSVDLQLGGFLETIISFGLSLALAIVLHHAVELPAHKSLVLWHRKLKGPTSLKRGS